MLCDAHLHWVPRKIDLPQLKPYKISHLLKTIKENKIVKINLIPPITKKCGREDCIEKVNYELIEKVKGYPHVLNAFPLLSDYKSFLKNLHIDLVKGVKIHFYVHDIKSLSLFAKTLEEVEIQKKIVILHAGSKEKTSPEDLLKTKMKMINFILSNFPSIRIIIAHSGRIWPYCSEGIKEFLDAILISNIGIDNIFFDTSTIRDPSAIKILSEKVGLDKIIWGTDYPYFRDSHENTIKEEINWMKMADLTENDLEKIFCNNYKNLFYPNGIWIRRILKEDVAELSYRLNKLPDLDKKRLALKQKYSLIKSWIRNENFNMWVIEDFNHQKIMGFLRFSDRERRGVFLEELLIFPEFRGQGLSKRLLNLLLLKASYVETKVFTDNKAMESLLSKFGFKVSKTSDKNMVRLWRWQEK